MNANEQTRSIVFAAKTALIGCIEDMNELSHNNYLEGGDSTDWALKFNVIRGKLDDCEDILDGLNEKFAETCSTYGECVEGKDA